MKPINIKPSDAGDGGAWLLRAVPEKFGLPALSLATVAYRHGVSLAEAQAGVVAVSCAPVRSAGSEPGDHDGIRDGASAGFVVSGPEVRYYRLADWLAAGNRHPDAPPPAAAKPARPSCTGLAGASCNCAAYPYPHTGRG